MTGARAALEHRALAPLHRSLGPRWALVHDGTSLPNFVPAPAVTVALRDVPGDVRGAVEAWPVQSESVTGLLVAVADGELAAQSCPEAARVLQPGGLALFFAEWRADALPGFDAAVERGGLRLSRRVAIRRAGVDPPSLARWLPWIESRRTAAATGDERIVCAIAASAPGGYAAALPTSREMLRSMFVPRAFGRDRGGG